MNNRRFYIISTLVIAGLVAALAVSASRVMRAQVASQLAYAQMYDGLAAKSADHHNLVDYYRSCVDNTRTNRLMRNVTALTCMDKTQAWSQQLKLTVPFSTIQNDILAGEAQVYLKSASH